MSQENVIENEVDYSNDNNAEQEYQVEECADHLQSEEAAEQSMAESGNIDSEPMADQLIIQPTEGHQTNFFCVGAKGAKIGRHSNNQILIYEESISRYHAEIIHCDDEFYLKDIGSTAGTFVKIQEQLTLQPGLIIEMGSNQFMIKEVNAASKKTGELVMLVIEGPNVRQEIKLQFSEKQNHYNIGRKQTNEISYPDDQHLSNIHSRINYLDQ